MAGNRRIALFVEGKTERAVPQFLHRWLDPQLPAAGKVGIRSVRFEGIGNYLDDVAQKVEIYLRERRANVVVGLVDLYGLPPNRINLSALTTLRDKVRAAGTYIRNLVPAHLRPYLR